MPDSPIPLSPSPLRGEGRGEGENSVYLKPFLMYLATERQSSARTIEAYRYAILLYLNHLRQCGTDPTKATKEIIQTYFENRKKSGLSASTIFQYTIALQHFHKFLLREGHAAADPTIGITLIKVENKLPQPLSVQEMKKLLEAPKGPKFKNIRNKPILELLYATGLRISELTGLRTDQVNLTESYLRVIGKRGKERIVPFGARAKDAIEKYLVERKKKFPTVSEPLFIGIHGEPLTRGGVWWHIKIHAKRAGITRPVSPHILRHSFATHMLSGGADLRAIQEMLGHKRITTTQIYTHVEPDHLRRVWDKAHPRQ